MCQQQARSGTKTCLFILVILVAVESQPVCPGTNTWECSNGDCIWRDWRCDGEVHCDGSDEQNCANWTCSPTWWKCANSKCIWRPDVCDGAFTCDDGSDEINCGNWACVSGRWKCGDESMCISYSKRCDKHDHCADGSDEQHCGAPVVESLTLDGHNYTITVDGDDHITLNLTCRMFGRTQGYVTITKESNTFGNVTFGINKMHYQRLGTWTYEAVLTLSDVTCDDMGRYTCSVGRGIGGTDSKSIQLNVACTTMKYGGNLTCPSEWKVGQDTKLMMTLDRSTWPSVCRTDPDRREAWFEVIRWNDTGRQSVMCTVVNITSPGACQGAFTPGTIGCGCVRKTDEHFTLEFNFVMDFSSFGNWSVDTYCLRTDFSKPLQLEVAPECHVRLACENNTYGARCQESCGHCADDQTCNASTGHCLACTDGWLPPLCKQGCENKTYGARCQESCGQCANNQTCNASTGHCPVCLDGWLPPLCNEGCENKTYGARCQESCGQCADNQTCNARTGHCPACLDGWLPPLCKEGCENKTYGARCQESCGQCANNQTCNASTGHCPVCLDGWLPPLCNEGCENKTYGARCQESCGQCADNQTCNARTGHCPACLDGWLPPLCKEACENKTYGERCQESCGHCADDQTCNTKTGHCPACLDGWLPPLCKQGCENKTYGARCQESCGHCADDQTCNTSTGHCPACLDDWLPPLCQEEAPAEEPLSPAVKIAIGVGVGAPASAVFLASLFQVCQFLSNMGYMPCISFGKKKEDTKTEEGGTDEGEKTEEEDETSDDAELSICSRCLTCMFCGGCVGSCLCCVTRGKMKSQGDVKLSEFPSDPGPVNNDTKEPITVERQERVASISEQTDKDGSADSNLEKNHEAHNKTRRKSILERFFLIPKQAKDKKKFIDNYFTTAEWLADPYRDPKRHNPTSWHRFYTSSVEMEKEPPRSSAFTFNSDELVGSETEGNAQKRRSSAFTSNSDELVGSKTEDISQAGQTIGKTQQGANTSLRRGSAQNEEQVNVIELMAVSEAEQGMSSVGQDGHFHDRSSESLEQPEQQEQTTGNTQSAGNSVKTVLEGEGSHRRTSQISGHSVDSGLS